MEFDHLPEGKLHCKFSAGEGALYADEATFEQSYSYFSVGSFTGVFGTM